MIKLFYNPQINKLVRWFVYFIFKENVPKVLRFPVNGTLKYKLFNGKELSLTTNETCFVTQEMFWNGGYLNYEYTNIFIDLIKSCDTFLDIGAQLGYYSILGKKINSNLEVHSFEPGPGPLHYLNINLKQNHLSDDVNCHEIALSEKNGTITFFQNFSSKYKYVKYPLRGGNNTLQPSMQSHNCFNVKTQTLDDFVDVNKLKSVSLIKIDTEGTEYLILNQGLTTIEKMRPIIITEMLIKKESSCEGILKLIESYDYGVYYYKDKFLWSFNGNLDALLKVLKDGVTDIFLIPKEKNNLINRKFFKNEKL